MFLTPINLQVSLAHYQRRDSYTTPHMHSGIYFQQKKTNSLKHFSQWCWLKVSWWWGFQDSRRAERVSPAPRCGENHTETVASHGQGSRSTVKFRWILWVQDKFSSIDSIPHSLPLQPNLLFAFLKKTRDESNLFFVVELINIMPQNLELFFRPQSGSYG